MSPPLGAVKVSQHLKKWKSYIYICRWTVWIHDKEMQQLGCALCEKLMLTWHTVSQVKQLICTWPQKAAEQALPSVMGLYRRNLISPFFKCIEIGLWIKVCTCCAYCTGMEEKLAYQTGIGIGLSNRYWLVPSTLPWSSSSRNSFQELASAP